MQVVLEFQLDAIYPVVTCGWKSQYLRMQSVYYICGPLQNNLTHFPP